MDRVANENDSSLISMNSMPFNGLIWNTVRCSASAKASQTRDRLSRESVRVIHNGFLFNKVVSAGYHRINKTNEKGF